MKIKKQEFENTLKFLNLTREKLQATLIYDDILPEKADCGLCDGKEDRCDCWLKYFDENLED